MKYCSNCGASNEDASRYCLNCGAELPSSEPSPDSIEPVPLEEPQIGQAPVTPSSKRPKRFWPWLLSGILLLLAASATMFYFLVLDSEAWKAGTALYRTTSALNDILDKNEALHTYKRQAEDIMERGHYQQSGALSLHTDTDDVSISLDFTENVNLDHKIADGTASLSITADGDTLPLEIPFSMNEQSLMLELSDLLDGTYCINFDTLSDDLQSSPLLDDEEAEVLAEHLEKVNFFPTEASFADFFKENRDKIFSFLDTIELKEVGTERRQTGGRLRSCTVYSLNYSKKQLSRLVSAWQEGRPGNPIVTLFANETTTSLFDLLLDNAEETRLSIDDRGYLVALSVEVKIFGSQTVPFVLSLEGSENPWNRVVFSVQDQEVLVGGIEERDDGCIIALGDRNSNTGLRLEIKDGGQSLTLISIASGKNTEVFTLTNSEKNGVCTTELQISYSGLQLEFSMALQPADTEPQMLSENATNLLLMTDEDYEALEAELEKNARSNPVYAWILDEID